MCSTVRAGLDGLPGLIPRLLLTVTSRLTLKLHVYTGNLGLSFGAFMPDMKQRLTLSYSYKYGCIEKTQMFAASSLQEEEAYTQ